MCESAGGAGVKCEIEAVRDEGERLYKSLLSSVMQLSVNTVSKKIHSSYVIS